MENAKRRGGNLFPIFTSFILWINKTARLDKVVLEIILTDHVLQRWLRSYFSPLQNLMCSGINAPPQRAFWFGRFFPFFFFFHFLPLKSEVLPSLVECCFPGSWDNGSLWNHRVYWLQSVTFLIRANFYIETTEKHAVTLDLS